MFSSIFYIILAILGIDFLILIHELGHYFMARKLGIKVEEFAVGFGKPIYQWERKGVKWKIGMIPFGGYVRMAGMEKQGTLEPSQVEGGFLAQKPLNQMKVAFMGPFVNIVFAFLAFSFLWMAGGRDKPFSEYTSHIGWVDQESGPYDEGIRSGDEIVQVNNKPFKSFEGFLYSAIYDKQALQMSGYEIDYETRRKIPFTYIFEKGAKLEGVAKASQALSTLSPAQYLFYDKMPSGAPNKLLPGSPLAQSGIKYGDRITWIDGELVFSKRQMIEVLNSPKVLLTVERNGRTFLTRIPRMQIADLRLSSEEKEEFDDWRSEAGLSSRFETLAFIPYNLNSRLIVEGPLAYIDENSRAKQYFESPDRSSVEIPLQAGDRIAAVWGTQINNSYELLKEIQTQKTIIIVKDSKDRNTIKWTDADKDFEQSFDYEKLAPLVRSIGADKELTQSGPFRLLNLITPVPLNEFPLTEMQTKDRNEKLEERAKAIEEISDPKRKEVALKDFQLYKNRLMLGVVLQDQLVAYNPSPFFLMKDVFGQMVKTFSSLITGSLSPKYMAGPIGIVQVIQYGWSLGVKEALYWLGLISLNLGLINLLPIPVLDGGHIVFALWEMVTRKPLAAKTRERLILPFVIFLIAVFIYFSYNDIVRIVSQFF